MHGHMNVKFKWTFSTVTMQHQNVRWCYIVTVENVKININDEICTNVFSMDLRTISNCFPLHSINWPVFISETTCLQRMEGNQSLNVSQGKFCMVSRPCQSMWDLGWTKWPNAGFSLCSSLLQCQYHSTNTPYWSPSTRCSYQNDKQAKHGNLLKSSTLSQIVEHWTEKYFHFCLYKLNNTITHKYYRTTGQVGYHRRCRYHHHCLYHQIYETGYREY
jgi:hypothetical protein